MAKQLKKISLETEGITALNAKEMQGTMGGSSVFCASSIGCIEGGISVILSIITVIQGCDREEEEDTSSEIIVEGACELDPAWCYSYA